MSTPPPPGRPGRSLPRARPAPLADEPPPGPAPVVRERVAAPVVDPSVILLRLEDRVEELRTWLAVVGVVAVASLGVALYAALDDDTSGATGSTSATASDERVTQVENRVDRLSRQVQDLRANGAGTGSAALANRVDTLESTVKSLSGQPAASGTQKAIDELSGRIDDLAADVQQLKATQTTP